MPKKCCFLSFAEEGSLNYQTKERLEFMLNGILCYLTFAHDVKTYLFPYSGCLPALANPIVSVLINQEPEVRSILVIPDKKDLVIPFSFFGENYFDARVSIVKENDPRPVYYQKIIDLSDYCLFCYDKDNSSQEERDLFSYAENNKKFVFNLFELKDIRSFFKTDFSLKKES